jgi:2-amino-4-hydroxy-6-hydroxymethyldihydropteridine diphosphokinase
MSRAYLSLGSNIGNRELFIIKAEQLINLEIGKIVEASSVYETEPWGISSGPYFLNKLVISETDLDPFEILEKLHKIEITLGRKVNSPKYSSRVIDIDILFIDNIIIESDKLKIPHPAISNRRFVLEPLAEVEKHYLHPVEKKSIAELLNNCNDRLSVRRICNRGL